MNDYDAIGATIVLALIVLAAVALGVAALWFWIFRPHAPGQAVRVVFTTGPENEEVTMLNISATGNSRKLTLGFVDAEDNPTVAPEGSSVPVWAPIDPLLGTLDVDADGMGALYTPGSPTSGQISVTVVLADGSLIVGVLDVVVTPGNAVRISIAVEPE